MPRHILYAYVDGSDLKQIEAAIERELELLVHSHTWSRPTWIVNQRHPADPNARPEDMQGWDLGLNHELPDPGTEPSDWFEEVEKLAVALSGLSTKCGRDFVIGIADTTSGVTEDLDDIQSGHVDIPRLRNIIGIAPLPSSGS